MQLVENPNGVDAATRAWQATFATIELPETVDRYDLVACFYNALHETRVEQALAHVLELAELLGYREIE